MKYIEIREPGAPEVLQLAEREPPQVSPSKYATPASSV